MLSVKEFYAESVWGLRFGASGSFYTIVPGRHLGQDIARTGDVPALLTGVIVRRIKTGTMAWGVVTDIGNGLYLSYWHLADDNLPAVGTVLRQGDRVGRIALGARTTDSPDWPGTAWTGPHCHMVIGTVPTSAYMLVPGHRTLDAFRDPLTYIRSVLAGTSSDGARPFDPNNPAQEDEEMALTQETKDWFEERFNETKRVAAPIKLYTYGSGVVAVNPLTGGWMILAPGYSELLVHLGYTAGGASKKIDDGQFGYATKYVSNAVGIPALKDAGLSDADVTKIKSAIDAGSIALSQAQYDKLIADVTAGARTGGEAGAKAAVENLSFVVKTN